MGIFFICHQLINNLSTVINTMLWITFLYICCMIDKMFLILQTDKA